MHLIEYASFYYSPYIRLNPRIVYGINSLALNPISAKKIRAEKRENWRDLCQLMMFFLTSTFSISAKELVRAFELSLGQGIKGLKKTEQRIRSMSTLPRLVQKMF